MCLQVPLKTDEASEMERRTKRERPRLEKKRVLENVGASLKDAEGQMCLRVCVRSPRHCVLWAASLKFSLRWLLRGVFIS